MNEKQRDTMNKVLEEMENMPDEQFKAELEAVKETPLYRMFDYALNGHLDRVPPLPSVNDEFTVEQMRDKLNEWIEQGLGSVPVIGFGPRGVYKHYTPSTLLDIVSINGHTHAVVSPRGRFVNE